MFIKQWHTGFVFLVYMNLLFVNAMNVYKYTVHSVPVIDCDISLMLFYVSACSPFQDDIFVVHIENDFSSMLESMFKTEFLMTLKKRYKDKTNRELPISFSEA